MCVSVRVLAVSDRLANAAVHLNQLGLRSGSYTQNGLWAPKEVMNNSSPLSTSAWAIVAIGGEALVDAAARGFADEASSSENVALVISGVGDDAAAWLKTARGGAALVAVSEDELSVIEGWISAESQAIATAAYTPDLRARAARMGEALGSVERICVTRGVGVSGAGLWCLGGTRPNGMKKPDPFFEHAGFESARGGNGTDSDSGGASEAFLAALMTALLVDKVPPPKALERACALAAYVASTSSAVPPHADAPEALRELFKREVVQEAVPTPAAYGGEAERRRAALEAMEAADGDSVSESDEDVESVG